MSISGDKLASSEDLKQHNQSAKMLNGAGPVVGSSTPTANYLPTVQCVRLNDSDVNIYKTDLQHDYKTEVCLKRADVGRDVEFGNESEATGSPDLEDDPSKPSQNAEDQVALAPDSTTSQLDIKHSFNCGDDVFVQHKDGRYYLGTVIDAEASGDRWLVRFGDNTEKWTCSRELRPLSSPGGNDTPAMCVICKFSKGNDDEVLACNSCNRGYHPACHDPSSTNLTRDKTWNCKRCVEQRLNKVTASKSRSLRRTDTVKNKQKSTNSLPYDLNCLHWDAEHRINSEKTYCYCGTNGDWFTQMIQCARCKQWFHSDCIICLKFPVYTGDRFYVFVCSLCNFGTEFLRRLEMKWVDLVHLVLFNLTIYHYKKYFDLDSIIIPYIKENWYALQLPQEMSIVSSEERREFILTALCDNGNRFKCGREIKKRTTIWGLRNRTPPPPPSPPTAPLPRGLLNDQALSGRWGRLSFVPYPLDASSTQECSNRRMIVFPDSHWKSIMTGKQFQTCSGSDVESPRSTPSPMLPDIPSGYQISNDFNSRPTYSNQKSTDDILESDYNPNIVTSIDDRNIAKPFKQKEYKFYAMDYQGNGFVKKSVPFPKSALSKRQKNESSKQRSRRKSYMDYDNDEIMIRTKKKLRKTLAKQKLKSLKTLSKGNSIDEESSFASIDHEGVPKDLSIVFDTRANDILPLTPPTSMSAPPTPPTSIIPNSNSNSSDVSTEYQLPHSLFGKDSVNYDSDTEQADFKMSKCSEIRKLKTPDDIDKNDMCSEEARNLNQSHNMKTAAMNLEISKLSTKNIIEHSKIMSLQHMNSDVPYRKNVPSKPENDSSGDDTSSRGTLDSIIPPPVNFQGVNNPFHNVNAAVEQNKFSSSNFITNKLFNRNNSNKHSGNYNSSKNSASNKFPRISLPVNLNPVIPPGVKLLKRQLSEKDLIIGPNGEVKRRRHRRTKTSNMSQNKFVNSKHGLNERQKSLRSSLCQEDVRNNDYSVNDLNPQLPSAVGSRCLRQRQEKNYFDGRRGSTSSNATSSQTISQNLSFTNIQNKIDSHMTSQRLRNPQSNSVSDQWNTLDDMKDLKSSVHSYFGTANRIETGEKFSFAGKRITDAGKLQYLIEWEGHGS